MGRVVKRQLYLIIAGITEWDSISLRGNIAGPRRVSFGRVHYIRAVLPLFEMLNVEVEKGVQALLQKCSCIVGRLWQY